MVTTYIEKQEYLPKCFICNGNPIVFKAMNGRFQIRCQNCHVRTNWEKKTNAVIDWFMFERRGNKYYEAHRRESKQTKSK